MQFKKFNGSTWETVQHKIYGSGTEQLASFPAVIQASGEPLTDYTIYGNTVQDGTPTPEAPVDVVGCGKLSDNLIPNTMPSNGWIVGYLNRDGTYSSDNIYGEWLYNGYIPVTPGECVTISASYGGNNKSLSYYGWDENKTFIQSAKADIRNDYTNATYIVPEGVAYISVAIRTFCQSEKELVDAGWWIMLNLGSTALPYEPYGYKIPITVNDTEHPIYLGEVETTRTVKKLVLTGEENWYNAGGNAPYRTIAPGLKIPTPSQVLWMCSHYRAVPSSASWIQYNSLVSWNGDDGATLRFRDTSKADVSAFKAFLSSEHANGTPVTIWYVLAEPETAAVNEPLMKIGNYADTISYAQAGVAIPTSDGGNTITFGTSVQPSAMSATFKGWHPVQAAKQYDGNDWS